MPSKYRHILTLTERLSRKIRPRDVVQAIEFSSGEDPHLLQAEWRRNNPRADEPNIWVNIREFCGRPRPEFCTRESLLLEMPYVKGWIQFRMGTRDAKAEAEALADGVYWRDLCDRFGIAYELVVPERLPESVGLGRTR